MHVARATIYSDPLHASSWQRIQQLEAPRAAKDMTDSQVHQKPSFTQPLQSVQNVAEGGQTVLDARLIPVNDPQLRLEW